MAEIRFDNGKTVRLSEETTDRLRKELIKDDKQLEVGRFRAVKTDNGIMIALVPHSTVEWDGRWELKSNADATHFLYPSGIKGIIAGLTRMLDE